MNNINILNKKECTGCSVCFQVCPHNCIKMQETKEGFHYPVIDEKLCTDCGLCAKRCHALNDNFKNDFKPQFYDVRANDKIRMKSSSGGMFTLLADYVFENKGLVCGASWTKDWLGVEHIIIDDKKDLDKLRGSKYLESFLGNIFYEIKKLLNERKLVLFSGTPCQVSALQSFLSKDYENLITLDLLCNSVVPQKVWRKYLLEKFEDTEKIEYISFRDKKALGWLGGCFMKFPDGQYLDKRSEDVYMKAFLEHISVKEECLHCKYRRFERTSDISIGDYWGVIDDDGKGVSLVLLNTLKGKEVFEKINKKEFKYRKIDNASNFGLGNGITPVFANRKYFFDKLDKENFKTLYKNSNNPKHNVAIVSMMFSNNYGAIMTVYALYKIIENLDYNPILIFNNFHSESLWDDFRANRFVLRYLNIANEHFSKEELQKIKEKCDIFAAASDQIWRIKNSFHWILDFVPNINKKKISYSSSFAVYPYDGDEKHKIYFRYYLNQFNSISVREKDGVKICKEEFSVEAAQVLDPVFLLENYDYLISKSSKNIKHKFIAIYLPYTDTQKEIDIISNRLSLNIEYLDMNNKETSMEDWLWTIKNSELLITDSFHGSCFAIIFNKPFVCILNERNGISRLESLADMFNIKNRIVYNLQEVIDNTDLLLKMDYVEINKKLEIEKEKSLKWLKDALEKPKNKSDYKDDMINLLIEENKEKDNKINDLQNKNLELYNFVKNEINKNNNWIKLFGIYNNKQYLIFYLFGIKISFKMNEKRINKIAWWIPIRKLRDRFRNKMLNI